MTTKSLRMQLGLLFATLGLASCTITPPDRGGVVATGISTTYRASDESRNEMGIDSWRVTLMSDDSKQVEAFDAAGATVGVLTLAWTADTANVEVQQPMQGSMSVSSSGELLVDQLSDPTLVLLFKNDAEEQLEAMGFRQSMACMIALKKSAELCKKAAITKKPKDILACSAAVAAAILACGTDMMGMASMSGGMSGSMSGGSMSGGSMSGGSMSGGSMSGGSDTDGSSDTENGTGGGETENGTGGGGTGGGGTGGGGTGGGGTGGGGTGGGGTGGGGTGGGGSGGYGDNGDGYGGDGYGGDDYGYAPLIPGLSATPAIPSASAKSVSFSAADRPSTLDPRHWDLER